MVLKNQREFLQKSFEDNYLKRTGFFFYSLESLHQLLGLKAKNGIVLLFILVSVCITCCWTYVYLKVFFEPVIGFYCIIFKYRQTFFSLKIDETLRLRESFNWYWKLKLPDFRFKIKFNSNKKILLHSIISKDVEPRNYLIVLSKTAEKKIQPTYYVISEERNVLR